MQDKPCYEDLLGETEGYLRRREAALVAKGVALERICWDAGFGFGKTVEHNFSILKHTARFADSGRPYLMGLSRKSALGAVTGEKNPAERVVSSVAGALLAVERGASVVRVHDVLQTRQAMDIFMAMQKAP